MRNCFEACKLMDVKVAGCFFTWTNKQEGESRVMSRIDRVVANQDWNDMFEGVLANFIPEGTFDHCPIILHTYKDLDSFKPFRFYNMWCNAHQF